MSEKDVHEILNFTFEMAVNYLKGLDSKQLSSDYFQGEKQINNKDVYKTKFIINNRLVQAVYKTAEFKEKQKRLHALKLFNEYLVILKLKDCKHILRRYGYYINYQKRTINFLYEYLEGNLETLIDSKSIDIEKRLRVMKALIETLMFVHSKGITLVDLSPRNIMFDHNWRLRVANFGIVKL
jgi:serine/threonine protein kinase